MPKIDLTGRVNGDFVVVCEVEPTFSSSGKKRARWLCECQTCHGKEIVLGDSIRRGRHKYCSSCILNLPEFIAKREETAARISELSEAAGYGPITADDLLNMYKDMAGIIR